VVSALLVASLFAQADAPKSEFTEYAHRKGDTYWVAGGLGGGAFAFASVAGVATLIATKGSDKWSLGAAAGAAVGTLVGGLLGYWANEGSFAAKVAIAGLTVVGYGVLVVGGAGAVFAAAHGCCGL
jgi:hypothetical protein